MADRKKSSQIDFEFEDFEARLDEEMTNLLVDTSEISSAANEQALESERTNRGGQMTEIPHSSEDNGLESKADLELDFDLFEAQLDKEIEGAFSPFTDIRTAEEPSPETGPVADGIDRSAPVNTPTPVPEGVGESEEESKLGFNFDSFAAQIDSDIDNLLTPSGGAADMSDQSASPLPADDQLDTAIDDESPETEVFAVSEQEPQENPSRSQDSQLNKLLEALSVAYLSLDWDFSEENLTSLKRATENLEPYCCKDKNINALYKIFIAVVNRMRSNPKSADRQLLDFIREAQALLKFLLLSGSSNGAHEREQLRELINRLLSIREQLMPKQEATKENRQESQPATSASTLDADASQVPQAAFNGAKLDDPRSLREWLEALSNSCRSAIQSIELEQKHLCQLETALAKKPALLELVERLSKIRSNLAAPMSSLRGMESECTGWIPLISNLEKALEETDAVMNPATAFDLDRAPEHSTLDQPVSHPASTLVENTPAVVKSMDIFFMDVSGWKLGVPAPSVVKAKTVSMKDLKKIFKRGYATITDFNPLFRSPRTGLLGAWMGKPLDELKGYRFEILDLDVPQLQMRSPSRQTVVLISNGNQHGMLLGQHVEADQPVTAEVTMAAADDSYILGKVQNQAGLSVGVIDPDKVLSRTG